MMTYAYQQQQQEQQQQDQHRSHQDSALDSKRSEFNDDEDSAVLDPSILDVDIMQSPHDAVFRKNSFANSNGVLSPADSQAWDPQYTGGLTVDSAQAAPSNPFHEGGEHGYLPHQSAHLPQQYAHQHAHHSWPFEQGSGNCTPTTGVDFMPPPAPFDAPPQYIQHRADSAHGSFSHVHAHTQPGHPHFPGPHGEPSFIPTAQVPTPMSPHSNHDYMIMAQQEMDARPSDRRMRPGSPSRSSLDYQRRDGIRKKNGRIDIPQERNIQTIDDLIERTSDEDILKELKQQKRLLRNREAALASRQRKKKHTEDLEVKEKGYTHQISMLESQLNELTRERDGRERERQLLHQRLQESQRIIDTMRDEKRDLIMKHNEECSQLRRKVQYLTDQLEAGPAPAMSAAPSSTGFTDFNAEMEALNMGPYDWDSSIFVHDLQNGPPDDFAFGSKLESSKASPIVEKKVSSSTVTQGPSKRNQEGMSEQPIASGLLFMLLLCGAFVASKPAHSQPPDLPNMPADVRAAAPTVLNNLLAENGPASGHGYSHAMTRFGQEPTPSSLPYASAKPSRLDRMHRTITTPSKQQEIDQACSLTPAQYASIAMTNVEYPDCNVHPGNEPRPQRRNLAEALANLEQNQPRNNKADVYTRSLLWDQIPTDVVRQFREMVRDCNEIEARQHQQRQRSDEFKNEQ